MLAGVLSVVAAAFYTVGLALQQQADLAAPPSPASSPEAGWRRYGRVARRVVSRPEWLGGFGLTAVGFVVHGAALSLGSLTTVQILQTSQIVFAVPLSARVAHVAVHRRDWAGAAMVVAGLALVLVALRPSEDEGAGTPDGWAVAVGGIAVVVIAVVLAARVAGRARAALLGVAAGMVFGVEGAVLKVASDQIADERSLGALLGPAVWATFVLAGLGVVLQNVALAAGRLAVALATITIAAPITSAVIGVAVFGEHLATGPLDVTFGLLAGLLATAGVVLLSHSDAMAPASEEAAIGSAPGAAP